jgi:hypothetical protein
MTSFLLKLASLSLLDTIASISLTMLQKIIKETENKLVAPITLVHPTSLPMLLCVQKYLLFVLHQEIGAVYFGVTFIHSGIEQDIIQTENDSTNSNSKQIKNANSNSLEKETNITNMLFQDFSEIDTPDKPADKFEIRPLRISKLKAYVISPLLTFISLGLIQLLAIWFIDLMVFLYYIPADEVMSKLKM